MAVAQDLVSTVPNELVNNFSIFMNIIQAIGVAIFVYIVFNIVNFFFSRRRARELEKISKNLEQIKRILRAQSKKK